jgi:hypothetical protein
MRRLATTLALLALTGPAAAMDDYEAAARAFLDASAGWTDDPMLIEAIRAQNARTGSLTEEEILALDATWRAEIGSMPTPTIDSVVATPTSDFLRARVAEAGGVISEIFVMDAVGLNVASSGVTSDYWQGDEEKFTATYPNGPDAIYVGPVEFDESSQTFQIQVAVPVVDPAGGEVVGAITLGLDAEAL